ncbi:MAG TPA: aminotransferase class I/II-fold pyridoxal phosphate-dependent enzyme [Xanthomonadaceae bacterium]|nr:aminotransferase class I/II-fold pyridoxal phosphate-dependent enzyme [Xanthomonadaceae bacterium]
MSKHSFFDDYSEGAHPRVLELLAASNLRQEPGYGHDSLTVRAAALLRDAIGNPGAAVHLLSGGTQANLVALAAMLRPFESVVAAESAHVAVHETGAIEATGHKVHALPGRGGKLTAAQVRELVAQHRDEHMVRPRVVFVSQPTELGTLYSAREMTELADACRELGLHLYLDGARLPAALASPACDLPLARLAALVDAFYLGGTKNGALLGEALVIVNPALQPDFRFHLKQRGALLAKGRVLGAQFAALLEDGLYLQLARHANAMAARLADGLRAAGVPFLGEPVTNQVFPILRDDVIAALRGQFGFHVWSRIDEERSAIRLVTSWATSAEAVDTLLEAFTRCR